MNKNKLKLIFCALLICVITQIAFAQTTTFTYQGRLSDGAAAANGSYDLGFALFNAATGGTQIGAAQTRAAVNVSNGVFTVQLDFGASPFAAGANRFLEIAVKRPADANFTTLAPRQQLTASPYSIQSLSATTAANFSGNLSGDVTGTQSATVVGSVGGQTAANVASATVTVGDATNLNNADAIVRRDASGNFIAGTINATTFNGNLNGTATSATNATNATNATTAGNVTGVVAVANGGTGSATKNFVDLTTAQTVGGNKTFSNTLSGNSVNSATQYTIGGFRVLSVAGNSNTFVGLGVGNSNTDGAYNSFFGGIAGQANTSGSNNSFFGFGAGVSNTTGSNNALFGISAGYLNMEGGANALFGTNAGFYNTGSTNSFFGDNAGVNNSTGGNNTFFGNAAGSTNITGSNNTIIGGGANVTANNLTYATAIGAGAAVSTINTIVLGRANAADRVDIPGGINLFNSAIRLRAADDSNHRINFNSSVNGIQFTAFDDFLWYNVRNNRANMQLFSNGNLAIVGSYLQFSDARYKTNVQTFAGALDAVRRLRGVTFNWKPESGKSPDTQIGFIAQEVEAVLPELVSTDKDGYKSVSYANAVPVLVEAVKEQQAQIQAQEQRNQQQQTQIERQQKQIDELKKIVCALKPDAEVCQPEDK